jgi:hypothetical protein
MAKALINSFGDLVITGDEGSVSYPTEFTQVIAHYNSKLPQHRRVQRTFIIGIMELPGENCIVHHVRTRLCECSNGERYVVVPVTHSESKSRKDTFKSCRGKSFKNKFIKHREKKSIAGYIAPVSPEDEDTLWSAQFELTEQFFYDLIGGLSEVENEDITV